MPKHWIGEKTADKAAQEAEIAELAAQADPNDEFVASLGRVEMVETSRGPALSILKRGHMPSDMRRKMLDRMDGAIDHAETLVMNSESPKVAIMYADLLGKYAIGPMKSVSIENEQFAKMVLKVIMEELGAEALDKCLPRIEAILMELEVSGE